MNSVISEFLMLASHALKIAEFSETDIPKHSARLLSLSLHKTFLDTSEKLSEAEKNKINEKLSQATNANDITNALGSVIDQGAYVESLVDDLRQTLVGLIEAGMQGITSNKKEELEILLYQIHNWKPQA